MRKNKLNSTMLRQVIGLVDKIDFLQMVAKQKQKEASEELAELKEMTK